MGKYRYNDGCIVPRAAAAGTAYPSSVAIAHARDWYDQLATSPKQKIRQARLQVIFLGGQRPRHHGILKGHADDTNDDDNDKIGLFSCFLQRMTRHQARWLYPARPFHPLRCHLGWCPKAAIS